MAHFEQREFCRGVAKNLPKYFDHAVVLDVGSLDINGNNRYLLDDCHYTGLDIIAGKNVDIICPIKDLPTEKKYKTIICTEMLEHDKDWKESLLAMFNLLQVNGLLLITCAGPGRPEHGTIQHMGEDSPATTDYYRNLSIYDLKEVFISNNISFLTCGFSTNEESHDTYFWGVK